MPSTFLEDVEKCYKKHKKNPNPEIQQHCDELAKLLKPNKSEDQILKKARLEMCSKLKVQCQDMMDNIIKLEAAVLQDDDSHIRFYAEMLAFSDSLNGEPHGEPDAVTIGDAKITNMLLDMFA